MKIKEGYMPFKGYQTYYRIVGERVAGKAPLLLLHGGPGSTHNYFELLDPLADQGHQLIMYDQLGCGNSYVQGQAELWTARTWVEELQALRDYLDLDQIHLLGQSWGGMLAIIYLCDYDPEGVQSLILSSSLSSARLWSQEQHRMIQFMSQEDQTAIAKAEASENYEAPAYQAANERFMQRHAAASPTDSSPEPLRREKKSGTEAYITAWGPNEYTPQGTLAGYEYTDKLDRIKVPTLITSGTNDLCTPLVAKTMYDHIAGARWELFAHSRHMPFVEENKKYLDLLDSWLEDNQ